MKRFAYLGWHGRGNLGDDAILEVYTPERGFRVAPLPLYRQDLLSAGTWKNLPVALGKPLLVGGGTIVGYPNWLKHIQRARPITRGTPHFVGVGVASPHSADAQRRGVTPASIAAWVPLLHTCEPVSVRGPLSARALEDSGVEADVTGDPAIVLCEASDEEPSELALSIGGGGESGGLRTDSIVPLATVASDARKRGMEPFVLCVNFEDLQLSRALARSLEPPLAIRMALTVEDFERATNRTAGLIGERLHAVILAASRGIPIISIAYQEKCSDFMQSVNLGECEWSPSASPGSLVSLGRSIFDGTYPRSELVQRTNLLKARVRSRLERLGSENG